MLNKDAMSAVRLSEIEEFNFRKFRPSDITRKKPRLLLLNIFSPKFIFYAIMEICNKILIILA